MMKRFMSVLAVAVAAFMAVPAVAQDKKVLGADPYAGLNAGLGFELNRDAAFNIGVAGGLNWTNFRTELAFDGGYQGGNAGGNLGSVSTNSFMWKNYIQAPVNVGRVVEPYAMVGMGLGLFSGAGAVGPSDLMWTAGAGVRTSVGKGMTLGLGYEYVTSQNTMVTKWGGSDYYRSNNVMVRFTTQF